MVSDHENDPAADAPPSAEADDRPAQSLLDLSPGVGLRIAGLAILAAVVWQVYGRGIHAPFIFDDRIAVLENPSIVRLWPPWGDVQNPGPLKPPRNVVTAGRPLVNLTLAVNYAIGGLDPTSYHVFNLGFHLLAVILLWGIVDRVLRLPHFNGRFDGVAGYLGWLIALIWAVHPLATETVEYISQRTELMMSLFYLATIYGSLRWLTATTGERAAWWVFSVVACLAGMLCKEPMVSAPVMVLLLEGILIRSSLLAALRASWPLYLGLALGWIPLVANGLTAPHSGTGGFHLGVSALQWWLTQAKVLMMYLKLCFWPWPLVIHYDIPYFDTLAEAWPWVLAALLLGLATLVLVWKRSAFGLPAIAAWMVLSPTLVIPLIKEVAAERRMYLPLAAIVVMVVMGLYVGLGRLAELLTRGRTFPKQWPLRATATFALIVAVVFFVASGRRVALYQDEVAIWQDALLYQPDDPVVRTNLAVTLNNSGRVDEAIEQMEQSIRLRPAVAEDHYRLGHLLVNAGRVEDAILRFHEALRLEPENPLVHNILGATLVNAGRPQEAIEHFQWALKKDPQIGEIHRHLGIALAAANRQQAAVDELREAARLDPNDVDSRASLALTLDQLGQRGEAIAAAEDALARAQALGQTQRAAQLALWISERRKSATQPSPPPDVRKAE